MKLMGLDNIWKVPEGTQHPSMEVTLCGGMFSGPGEKTCESFRGKVYHEFIESLSGISLYQDSIEGDELKLILSSLVQFKECIESIPPGYRLLNFINDKLDSVPPYSIQDGIEGLSDLITMFSKYCEIEGAELVSWY